MMILRFGGKLLFPNFGEAYSIDALNEGDFVLSAERATFFVNLPII